MTTVQRITNQAAADALAAFRLIDPDGVATVETAVRGARCYCLEGPGGWVVFALSVREGRAWVHAAAGRTRAPMTPDVLRAIETIAAIEGARWVGFQTARRGLVRRARACGWTATPRALPGFAMERAL